MSIIITKANAKRHQRELDMAYRFRHDFFVDGMGWEALRKPDGREIDDFDSDDTVHVMEIADGRVLFYSRLLPTLRPHLLSHLYRELLQGEPEPVGPDVWEQSRGTVVKRRLDNGMPNPLCGRVTLSIIEAAMFVGANHLLTETHPLFLTRCLEHGYRPQPLAPPVEMFGNPLVAVKLTVDAETLQTTRRFYDQWEPVVHYNGQPVIDLLQQAAA